MLIYSRAIQKLKCSRSNHQSLATKRIEMLRRIGNAAKARMASGSLLIVNQPTEP